MSDQYYFGGFGKFDIEKENEDFEALKNDIR